MRAAKNYSIGEFSEKTGISIRTLHYYDEIGLLEPEKHPSSGHRIYTHEDIITIQKIVSLKFLGYSLEEIGKLLGKESFSVDLVQTLTLQLDELEKNKEKIEYSIAAIKRVIKLMEEEGEVDSHVLFALIHSMQTEPIQYEWLKNHNMEDVLAGLSNKTEEEKIALDQTYIQLVKDAKKLYGRPIDDPNVQEMIKNYLEASFAFLGPDLMEKLAHVKVDEIDIQQLENAAPSPFTEEEESWLNEAIAYSMKQSEME